MTIDSNIYRVNEVLTFHEPSKPVGYWVMYPGSAYTVKFTIYMRPTDDQIKNTEALLGWGWEDAT